jgi:hypothetical protein
MFEKIPNLRSEQGNQNEILSATLGLEKNVKNHEEEEKQK